MILHFNMTNMVWSVPWLNTSTSFFTLARFLGRQAVACPSPLLSTSKPFLAIFTISNHLVTLDVESFIKLICIHVFNLASFKRWDQSICNPSRLINYYSPCLLSYESSKSHNKQALHELHLHCCLVFELDCFEQYIILPFIKYLWDNLLHVHT